MSVKEFREYLLDSMLNILWKQWAALGIYSNVEQENKYLIDPESLLYATCSFGRFDQRLFDEVIIWLGENGNLLNIDRLKNVQVFFDGLEINILGAIAEYLVQKKKKKKWDRVVLFCERKKKEDETQDLFMTKDLIPIPIVGKFEDSYLASSEFREISEILIPKIKSSGVEVLSKHLGRATGELFTHQFIDYVEKILHQLLEKTN